MVATRNRQFIGGKSNTLPEDACPFPREQLALDPP